ncbi:unnamed protein product [Thlaspi arvense]|uniref:Uncharacterized protein n=1 Tax=Thlaspi arvense TaxID=13288 RepID=A0AAU9RA22_THLAR|nr:unnamed protein product [Thlaspi arvense]
MEFGIFCTASLSAEDPALIETTSVNDGNAPSTLHAFPAVPMVTQSNSYSVSESCKDISDHSDMILDIEEVVEDVSFTTMETRESPMDPETLQGEETSAPRSCVGRNLKPTQKIQDQWITIEGRGKRGRGGRGGRELFNS